MFSMQKDVLRGQSANCFLRLQIRFTAFFIGNNIGGYGFQLYLFAPSVKDNKTCNRFYWKNTFKRKDKIV